jgi:hypothetical protein
VDDFTRNVLRIFIFQYQPTQGYRGHDSERLGYDSLIIILQTLERCLSGQSKDTARFEEAINVKLLLREICQFIGKNDQRL